MTTEEILNLNPYQIARLSEKELRKAINQLNSVANKRLARIERRHLELVSPAYQSVLVYRGGRFRISEPGATKGVLRIDLGDVKRFLENKTSRIPGVKSNLNRLKEITGLKTEEEINEFFKLYEKFKEEQALTVYQFGYRNVWKGIKDFVQSSENKEWDKFVEEYTKALREQEF